jgi:hypothetical protein
MSLGKSQQSNGSINYQQQTGTNNSPTATTDNGPPANLNNTTLSGPQQPQQNSYNQYAQTIFGSGSQSTQPVAPTSSTLGGQTGSPIPVQVSNWPTPYQGIGQTAGQTGAPTGQSLGGQMTGTAPAPVAPTPISQPLPVPGMPGGPITGPAPTPNPSPIAPQPTPTPFTPPSGWTTQVSPGAKAAGAVYSAPPISQMLGASPTYYDANGNTVNYSDPPNLGILPNPIAPQPIGSYLGADGQMHGFGDGYTGGAGDPGSFGPVGLSGSISTGPVQSTNYAVSPALQAAGLLQ